MLSFIGVTNFSQRVLFNYSFAADGKQPPQKTSGLGREHCRCLECLLGVSWFYLDL